jgi:hypothetical protein
MTAEQLADHNAMRAFLDSHYVEAAALSIDAPEWARALGRTHERGLSIYTVWADGTQCARFWGENGYKATATSLDGESVRVEFLDLYEQDYPFGPSRPPGFSYKATQVQSFLDWEIARVRRVARAT